MGVEVSSIQFNDLELRTFLTACGLVVTFLFSCGNFLYTWYTNKKNRDRQAKLSAFKRDVTNRVLPVLEEFEIEIDKLVQSKCTQGVTEAQKVIEETNRSLNEKFVNLSSVLDRISITSNLNLSVVQNGKEIEEIWDENLTLINEMLVADISMKDLIAKINAGVAILNTITIFIRGIVTTEEEKIIKK